MLLTLHTFNVQDKLYVDGLCQRDFLTSLDAQMADSLMSNKIVIRPAAKARWWVGKRAVFQRQQYAQVRVIDAVAPDLSNFTRTMDKG
jgi:hypothetical protein